MCRICRSTVLLLIRSRGCSRIISVGFPDFSFSLSCFRSEVLHIHAYPDGANDAFSRPVLERRLRLLDHRHRVPHLDHGHGVAGEPKPVRLGAVVVRDAMLSHPADFFRVLI